MFRSYFRYIFCLLTFSSGYATIKMVNYVVLCRKNGVCMNNEVYEAINRWIIPGMWIMAGFSLCLFAFVIALVKTSRFDKKTAKSSETAFRKVAYYWIDIPYTVFIVLISLFPLMGMLGTVSSLLTLDISGASENLKSNFFQALNTTGLGLILAIFFKLANAFFQPGIEECIAKAKKLLENGGVNE